MTPAYPIQVFLKGAIASPELAPAVAWLRENVRCSEFQDCRPVDSGAFVFCVARPGQICRSLVEELHRSHPFSPMIALVGPWCEGEVRSGKPWPGVARIYWHQWQSRLPREMAQLSHDAHRLPRSATEVDALLSRPSPQRASRPALIGVVSSRQSDFEAIALALDAGGHHPCWIATGAALPVVRLDVLVVDEDGLSAENPSWPVVWQKSGAPRAILLANFPRPNELAAGSDAQQVAVMAKPYLVADLLNRIDRALGSMANVPAGSSAAA